MPHLQDLLRMVVVHVSMVEALVTILDKARMVGHISDVVKHISGGCLSLICV